MPDFAPGIPNKLNKGRLMDLPTDVLLTLVRQHHKARRAGDHTDMRIGNESGLFSWALPKHMPEAPGQYRLAIPTSLHRYSYKDFEGEIPEGKYGAGTVTKMEESPVVLLKNTPSYIEFTRGTSKDSNVYRMVRTGGGNWLLSIKQPGEPEPVAAYKKEHFKSVPVDKVPALIDQGASISPKIDGAASLVYLGKNGLKAYGVNPMKNGLKPDYTAYIGSSMNVPIPEDIQGKMLRAELYGYRNGKTIPANELAGILNSNLAGAIDKKQKRGLQLILAALAVHKDGLDDYNNPSIVDIVSRVKSPALYALPQYRGEKAKRLLKRILAGRDPLTSEGAVLHIPGRRPMKSKVRNDFDVEIQNIFPADTKSEPRAGGFEYSLPGTTKVIGRVGSGFTHDQLRDMLNRPEDYVGRTARIYAQEQYPESGAYRAPVFAGMKPD